jgi:hypothetical protein
VQTVVVSVMFWSDCEIEHNAMVALLPRSDLLKAYGNQPCGFLLNVSNR